MGFFLTKIKVVALVKGSLSIVSCQFLVKILMSYKQNIRKLYVQESRHRP